MAADCNLSCLAIRVHRVVTGRWSENSWVVASEGGDALLIDPGGEAERIISRVEQQHLRPLTILATHGHHDHVGAAAELRTRLGIPFLLHPADERTLAGANFLRVAFEKTAPIELPAVDRWLPAEGGSLAIGRLRLRVLPTPGHTPGGVSFVFGTGPGEPDLLFCGDTLFRGRVARTDLPGGSGDQLVASLRRLTELPSSTLVYPGHGDPTDLATELATNAPLRELLE